jgi:hypothetical protein
MRRATRVRHEVTVAGMPSGIIATEHTAKEVASNRGMRNQWLKRKEF